jgi:cholesterol transport system auxiliary component
MMTARPQIRTSAPAMLAAVAFAALAVGCSFSRPAPVKQEFLLEVPSPPPVAKSQSATLQVRAVTVAAPFRSRSFVYRTTDLRYDSDFYTEFVVSPGAMLADGTARALERSRVFARVVPPGSAPDGDFVLDGFFDAFYVDLRDPAKPAAEVSVTYFLSRGDPLAGVPFWSKQYQRRVPIDGSSVDRQAAALSSAFAEVMRELSTDLAAVNLPKP